MAKNINTRIQLKRDTLAKWNASSFNLKAGELAIAYVDVATKDAKGDILHVPTALLKAGNIDGNASFKDLPFVSALAADVYGWAKKEGIEVVEAEGTAGEVISNIEWKEDKLVITRTDVVTPDDLATALADYYTKDEIDQKFADLELASVLDRITTLETKVGAVEEELATYGDIVTHDVDEFATAEQGAKADAAAVKADVDEALADRYTKGEADAKFETIANVDLVRADITAINAAETGIYDRAVAYVDNKFTTADLDKYTTEQEVKDIVDEVITNAVDGDTLTSLTDLVEYLSTHGGEYAELAATVEDHENRIDAIEPKVEGWDATKTTVDTNKETWDKAGTALQAADIATGSADGTIAVKGTDVAVKGLGSAAFTEATAYATAAQGAKAETAVQSVAIATGSENGKIKLTVDGTDTEASVAGIQDAAFKTTAEIKTEFAGSIAEGDTGFVAGSDIFAMKEALEESIANVSTAVTDLDYADNESTGIVTGVTQEDGKISVKRETVTTDMIEGGSEVWIFDCGDSSEN